MILWHEIVGGAATVVAVAGVVLNNRHRWQCFVLWLASNSATLAIHVSAGLWSLAARDGIFLALAVEGLVLWRRKVKR
jgi:nicotinamide mononucleotide transporter